MTTEERLTVYAGTVTADASGEATVELPAWFEALNGDLRYQLTPLGKPDAYAVAHPLIVERAKTGRDKGRFLNPVEHGQPEPLGVDYEHRQRGRRVAAARF